MLVLGIETSGPACRVAILDVKGRPATFGAIRQCRTVEVENAAEGSRHAESIFALLDSALAFARRKPRDLGLVAVSLGPGSFTGLRVGLAAAKVFAGYAPVPLTGVPTLEARAAEAMEDMGWRECAVTGDAKRGEVYFARFKRGPKGVRKVAGPLVCRPEEVAGPFTIEGQPRAASVAVLGFLRFLTGKRDDWKTLVPAYVRRPEAVEKMRAGLLKRLKG